jgi:hypothetical protein
MYGLDSFFTTCAQTIIAHHQWFSLVPSLFVSYYRQHVSIALQHVQTIVILQQTTTFGQGSSSLPCIIGNAPPSLLELWQTTAFSS